jgi:drug/metabolite transporter (DMT)-like permease
VVAEGSLIDIRSNPRSRTLLAFAALAVTMLLWSGNMIVGRAVSGAIPPFALALIRWTGASCVVLPFALPHIIADRAVLRRAWKPVLLLGLTGVASFNAFIYSGLRHTTATNAILLQAGIPPLVLLLDRLLFRIRPSGWQVIGVLLSTLGVLVIISAGELGRLLGLRFGSGDLLVLCGVTAWAIYTSLLKLRPACHPLSFLGVTFAIGVVAMVPLAASEAAEIARIHWTAKVIGGCLYVALFPSVVAYFLFNAAVAEVGAGRAGQTINLMPLFGALLAAAILGEPLERFHFAGMALIAVGIAASWMTMRRARPREPAP